MKWLKPIPYTWKQLHEYPEDGTYNGWFCCIADQSSVSRDEFYRQVTDFIRTLSLRSITTSHEAAILRYNVGIHLGLIKPPTIQTKRRHYV
jgi:hypothetical protein